MNAILRLVKNRDFRRLGRGIWRYILSNHTWPKNVECVLTPPSGHKGRVLDSPPQRPRLLVTLFGGGFRRQTERIVGEMHSAFDIRFVSKEDAKELGLALGQRCSFVPYYDFRRRPLIWNACQLIRGGWQMYKILRDDKIDGALGIAGNLSVSLAIAAKLGGIPFVFVESAARATQASLTGRLLSLLSLADRIYVQWPEATRLYRRAIYRGSTL